MKKIDEKLEIVYNFVEKFITDNGFPPSVREICEKLNIKSTATASSYLQKLNAKGLLNKPTLKKRALSLPGVRDVKRVPLIGSISAGLPILAVENIEGYYPIPDDFSCGGENFALKISGDSMKNAGIFNGDVIIVRKQETANNGEIVVALIDDSATVKRFYKKNNHIVLHPENEQFSDQIYNDVNILGIVVGLFRKF